MSQMKIVPYHDDWKPAWDTFVFGHPEATLFHSTAWKRAIERAFGFESRYLLAEETGQIRGILPLFLSSNMIQGRTLISTPFAVYGGICTSDPVASFELRQAACAMAAQEGVDYLELREPFRPFGDGFLTKELYVTFEQQLPRDPEKLMKGFPKDTRYMIRKGQKSGLVATTNNAQLDAFHDLYAHSVRNLGTPVFSKNFFEILLVEFGDAATVTVISHESKPMAGVLSFYFRDAILPYYAGSLMESRRFGTNNFMFWELLRTSCERGLRTFDFGRSKLGTGSYFFKTQWNMNVRPLPYQFYLVRRKTLPNFSPVNPKFKLATEIWKRMPLSLTKTLGPPLVRMFP